MEEELDDGEERDLPRYNVRELGGEQDPVELKHQTACNSIQLIGGINLETKF